MECDVVVKEGIGGRKVGGFESRIKWETRLRHVMQLFFIPVRIWDETDFFFLSSELL